MNWREEGLSHHALLADALEHVATRRELIGFGLTKVSGDRCHMKLRSQTLNARSASTGDDELNNDGMCVLCVDGNISAWDGDRHISQKHHDEWAALFISAFDGDDIDMDLTVEPYDPDRATWSTQRMVSAVQAANSVDLDKDADKK
eukprot:TRINITY_DN5904_c0_g1_i1.p1 TRINITY_DN5904_c0_g1~~TRINITY_DN5904_c0_g1_i1.p1  ORF type:complete len:159 (-),score=48.40 TRINITY_DN5904_c0_g1_i1:6-443(-)